MHARNEFISLKISELAQSREVLTASICQGESFEAAGKQFTGTGWYSEIITNADINGCDSIVEINLTVRPIPIGESIITTCDDTPITFNGKTFVRDTTLVDTLFGQAANGCDSLDQLILNVYPTYNISSL